VAEPSTPSVHQEAVAGIGLWTDTPAGSSGVLEGTPRDGLGDPSLTGGYVGGGYRGVSLSQETKNGPQTPGSLDNHATLEEKCSEAPLLNALVRVRESVIPFIMKPN